MDRPHYVQSLTALRGIAAWWVVLYHFREIAPGLEYPVFRQIADHGYLAVDLFFIMSGFVISLGYGRMFDKLQWIDYRKFVRARIARLYPLHLSIMVAYLVNPIAILLFSAGKSLGVRYEPGYYVLSLFLVQNWGFTNNIAWNVPAWSISAELFVYLTFPFLWMAGSILAKRCLLQVGTVFTLIATAAIGYFVLGGLGGQIAKFGLARCFIEFTLGVLLFLLVSENLLFSSNKTLIILISMTIAGMIFGLPDYTLAPFAFMLLIAALLDRKGIGAKLLNIPLLIWLGEISYSTYLAHYLVRDWIKFTLIRPDVSPSLAFAVYLAVVFGISPILYHAIEQPGRRLLRSTLPLRFPSNPTLQRQTR